MSITITITDNYGMSHCDIAYHDDPIYKRGLCIEGNQKDALIKLINAAITLIEASEWPKTTGNEDYSCGGVPGTDC